MLTQVDSPQNILLNKKLRDRLLKLVEKDQERIQNTIDDTTKSADLLKRMRESRQRNTLELCPILKEFGWPTIDLVGKDGVDAAFLLLKNSSSFEIQTDLMPVIIAAVKKGQIPRASFAGYLDRLRLSAGLKQLFGTQVTVDDGFLVLYPIESEAYVDARRKQYDLPPLVEYLRALERVYQKPLVKAPGKMINSFAVTTSIGKSAAAGLFEGQLLDENEVVRVETNLVSLNVSVYSQKLQSHVSMLEEKDFRVSEDGHEETIAFFAATDVPFDLVLLIDLSGSTAGKRNLIQESTRRFIQAARPSDRLAIVTFSDATNVMSPLTTDHSNLLESVGSIEGSGSSHVWDALKFTLDRVVGPKTLDRRRAVVFMTDGFDNSLGVRMEEPSTTSFADLVETVRGSDTLIIPIYLDTEAEFSYNTVQRTAYENARRTLMMLADESGGLYYKAKKLEDLKGVYGQVIEDLGKVYSLGYNPTNSKRDGTWRAVKIEIPNQPDLKTRTRPGYYAK